jgi:hypothetical protein
VEESCADQPTQPVVTPGDRPPEPSPAGRDTERDDAREEKRAQVYGVQLKELLEHSIVVGPGKYVRLSGLSIRSEQPGLVRLRPKDLDDVKRWIGVSDELGAKRSCCTRLPAEVPAIAGAGDIRKLDPQSQLELHNLAEEYVHGDSRQLVAYKRTLDHLVDRAIISGAFTRQDIDIHTGAVLEIDRDLKILFARHIRIWRGGLLKLKGPTKIDCVSITGNLPNFVAAVDRIPSFASYVSLEAANG